MKIETPQLSGKPRKVNCWDVESFAFCWFLLLFMLVRANNLFWCLFWVSHLIASHAPICSNTSHWKRIKLRLIFPERLLRLFFWRSIRLKLKGECIQIEVNLIEIVSLLFYSVLIKASHEVQCWGLASLKCQRGRT